MQYSSQLRETSCMTVAVYRFVFSLRSSVREWIHTCSFRPENHDAEPRENAISSTKREWKRGWNERRKERERERERDAHREREETVEGCISLERNLWAHRPLLYNNRGSSTLALYISILHFFFYSSLLSRRLRLVLVDNSYILCIRCMYKGRMMSVVFSLVVSLIGNCR